MPITEVNEITGAVTVADIINGYRVSRTYYGYTVEEAIELFIQETTER